MKTTLSADSLSETRASLQEANLAFNRAYPGESTRRQPIHSVYGGAHLFKADMAVKLAQVALRSLEEYAPDARTLAQALGLVEEGGLAERVYARVQAKLRREAVEDYRIDFEDGFGYRPDEEEDAVAVSAAEELARGLEAGTLPPFIGIRLKSFSEELFARSVRTLDLFVTTLLERTGGRLPEGFVVTLPKVTAREQVTALVEVLERLEEGLRLERGSLKVELMMELPQTLVDWRGQVVLPLMVAAAKGRCTGVHFGTYDYTAACNITASHQHMLHPACDFARSMMQVCLSGTGIHLSDGATNIMPVGPHKAPKEGSLTPAQVEENRAVVHRAWRINYEHVRHSLANALYQGWDLHPAQLPVRYAAVYAFFLEGLDAASRRLRAFMDKAAQATLLGDVFDDAATGQGLLNFFLRGIACGALTEDEARAAGLSMEELRTRSFLKILEGRRGG
ncbi:MAG TPA: phosphoenolpyruvate kinase [Myxococcaceae bacterium]|nr:phosphoenolpyruvate kinase [Myxococcaceae bacterium]